MISKKDLQFLSLLFGLLLAVPAHAAEQAKTVPPMLFTLLLGGPDYQEVTSLTGRIWLDRNLGASRVATSPTDTAAYGDMYQWGRLSTSQQRTRF